MSDGEGIAVERLEGEIVDRDVVGGGRRGEDRGEGEQGNARGQGGQAPGAVARRTIVHQRHVNPPSTSRRAQGDESQGEDRPGRGVWQRVTRFRYGTERGRGS